MKKNGFTIIEMMIVIAIGGIVAAVVLPALKGKNHNGQEVVQMKECASVERR